MLALARKQDPYQFQWWALGLLGASPVEQNKKADKGIDGRINFHGDHGGGRTKQIIVRIWSVRLHRSEDGNGYLKMEEPNIRCKPEPHLRHRPETTGPLA